MGIAVVVDATSRPVELEDAKLHLRVDGAAEDALIEGLIAAASDYVEQYTGRSLAARTLRLDMAGFMREIVLPRGPVQAVSNIKYYDQVGGQQTLPEAVYEADLTSDPQCLLLADGQSWPTTSIRNDAVSVTYVTGYADAPAPIKQAILLLVGDWYRIRENTVITGNQPNELPHAVTALLANYRSFAG